MRLIASTNVDTVIVGGTSRRRHGQLVGVDLSHVRDLAENARAAVLLRAADPHPAFA